MEHSRRTAVGFLAALTVAALGVALLLVAGAGELTAIVAGWVLFLVAGYVAGRITHRDRHHPAR